MDPIFIAITLLVVGLSMLNAILPHPDQVASRGLDLLLRVLGRFSFLRHYDSPGTLHCPLTRQPSPLDPPLRKLEGGPIGMGPTLALPILCLVLLVGCKAALTPPRQATAQALQEHKAMATELEAFSTDREKQIFAEAQASGATREEGLARRDIHRKAVDFALELLKRGKAATSKIAAALGGTQ